MGAPGRAWHHPRVRSLRPPVVMPRLSAAVLALPLLGACTTDTGETLPVAEAASVVADAPMVHACAFLELDRHHLRLPAGDFVYVEPQVIARGSEGWILAGQPTYRVRVGAGGRGGIVERDAWFGVIVTDGVAEPIAMPPLPDDGRIAWVRGMPSRRPGRSGFLYEVTVPAASERSLRSTVSSPDTASRLVFAEYDAVARSWEIAGELPTPANGRLRGLNAVAGPLQVGGATVLAVPHELPLGGVDVLLYARRGSGWTVGTAWTRWTDEIAIGRSEKGDGVLALAGLDPDFDARRASIRAFGLNTGADAEDHGSPRRLQSGGPGERFGSPVFGRAARRLDLGWLRRHPEMPTSAWVSVGVRVDPGAPHDSIEGMPHLIDPAAAQIVPVDGSSEASLWLTAHVGEPILGGRGSIVATLVGPDGAIEAGRVPNPFHGPFAALRASPDEVLVVGPEARFDPTSSYVRSLVIRLSIRCTP